MPTKIETYCQMADRTTGTLTAQVRDWTRFLLMAGRFYKYNFLDQVMIYTQRPEATACAEFELWTRRMGRHVRRGAQGIALLRQGGGKTALRYVFDVADTVRGEDGRDPRPWQYREEYQAAVTARLEEAFKVPGGEGLEKQLIGLAVQFADEHWRDFKDGIMASVHDSLLEELDEDNVAYRFCPAVTVSLSYLLLARCGFDLKKYFTAKDFACIKEFNTRDTVLALGNAVSESASVLLRQVEYAIKKYEHDKAVGASSTEAGAQQKPGQPPEGDTRHKGREDAAA